LILLIYLLLTHRTLVSAVREEVVKCETAKVTKCKMPKYTVSPAWSG